MKATSFLCAACLFLVFTCPHVTVGCDPYRGPAGGSMCYQSDIYTRYQCGTCLTNAYIVQRSRGDLKCRNPQATYCVFQCMIEKHNVDSGSVYSDCQCNPNNPLPQPSVILPHACYSPDGTDCGWYRRCLARMYPCTGQAEYAIQYGQKYCDLYRNSQNFTLKTRQWIDAARRCLQVALVPLLHLCRDQPTCETIRTTALNSHSECYLNPYQGPSICELPTTDWYRIYWTIKSSYKASPFVELFKAALKDVATCTNDNIRIENAKNLYAAVVRHTASPVRKRATNSMSNDELAHSIFHHVSSSLKWDKQSTVNWYAFAADTNQARQSSTDRAEKELTIQLFVVDLVNIGLMNTNSARGRRRLSDSITQLSDVIKQGLTGTVHNFRFDVTSLRQCTSGTGINNGCINGTLLAKASASFNGKVETFEWIIIYWLFIAMPFILRQCL